MKLSAVAEVYSSAVDDEGVPLVIRASKKWRAVVGVGPVCPGGECGSLVDGMTVPEPIEHSVVGVPNEVHTPGRSMYSGSNVTYVSDVMPCQ